MPARTAAVLFLLTSAALAQDPIRLNPEQFHQEIDNNWVRVLRMKQGPYAKTALHHHPAVVVVYLTDVRQRVKGADGKTREVKQKSGDVAYFEEGMHSEESLLGEPTESVVVELKPGVAAPPSHVTLDPVKLDPEHHAIAFENEKVRVLRTILTPKAKTPMHEHPAYVAVSLPGEIAWRDPLKHETLNSGDKTALEIQIELK